MNKYHKQQAQIRYEIDGYICQKCGKQLNAMGAGLAHRMSQSEKNKNSLKKIYGSKWLKILNHNYNLVPSCLECNSSFLIDNKPRQTQLLIDLILNYDGIRFTSKQISDLINS